MPESEEALRPLFTESRTIAVVGCSADPLKPPNFVPRYLQAYGYRIVPVNPGQEELLGERCYPALRDVDVPVDVVQVFRPPAEAPGIVRDAAAIGARAVWLQLGLISDEAERVAAEHGIQYVQDNCMGLVHGHLGLGPGLRFGDEWHRGLQPVVLGTGTPRPVLRVAAGPGEGKEMPLVDGLEIGRAVAGPGSLEDTEISRRHARVSTLDHGQLLLEDVGSTNGTYVNGARIVTHVLAAGDMIQVGRTTLEIVTPEERSSLSAVRDRLSLAAASALRSVPAIPSTDPGAFRAEFPVFERVAYLNTGTDGPVPRRAAEAAAAGTAVVLEQGRSGESYRTYMQAIGWELRERYARALGCDADEVALTGSTNDGVNTVLSGLHLRRRDEIVTSDEEHPSLLAPLAAAKKRLGVDVRIVPFGEVANAIGPRTRLVACSHVSWISGRVVDYEALAASEVPVLLDGAQGLGAVPADVRALGCDYYAASGQKWLCGPDGTGCLYVRRDRTDTLTPPWSSYFSLGDAGDPLALVYHSGARRFDAGGIRGALVTWALGSLEVLEEAGLEWVMERARTLAASLAEDLEGRGVDVIPRGPSTLVSWRSEDCDGEVVRLADEGLIVRSITVHGVVRASVGAWNSEEELARLAKLAARDPA